MIYKHQYFKLDTEKKKLYDEHGREAFILGTTHSFRLLELLCQKWPSVTTLTDINFLFDPAEAKEYKNDYIRNLRGQIKRALGHEIIEYNGSTYALIGDIKKSEKDLEHKDFPTTAPIHIEKKKIFTKYWKWLSGIVIIALVSTGGWYWLFHQGDPFIQKPADDMVLIPAGEFKMGSTEEQINNAFEMCKTEEGNYCISEDYFVEYPQRIVKLGAFYIDRKEASNSEFTRFIKATGKAIITERYAADIHLNGDNQPVVGLSWYEANDYCVWLNKRLPTEEEWERAARGADGRIWPWGNAWDIARANHGIGGAPGLDSSDGYEYTAPVGTELGLGPEGVLNIAGNVSEWVDDDFKPYLGNDKYGNEQYGLFNKVVRGGSYNLSAADIRTAYREYAPPEMSDETLGFRCAKDAK